MNKSLYSLMLMDDVVAEIDKMALREGTSRSNLVNQILAEYVSMTTPEMRIDSIFRSMEKLMSQTEDLVPFFTPNQLSMSMKSSLEYKYRPTIKYVVQMYRVPDAAIGELNVNIRTQSEVLLTAMENFFRLWKRLEDAYVADSFEPNALRYEIRDSKLVRTIAIPKGANYTSEELGQAISAYVKLFDSLMKAYIGVRLTNAQLESAFVNYLNQGNKLI